MTADQPTPDQPSTAVEIARAVRGKQLKATAVTAAALERAKAQNPALNAFLHLFQDRAMSAAAAVDSRIESGEADSLPLAGVPIAIKDNICLGPDLREKGDSRGYGGPTTCGSRILEHYHAPFTATAAQRLIDAGAILIGKTNMDEFAMGSSTEHSAFGPTRNPHDHSRVPGGSSGGSAAAVAAGITPVALGSDTGGSIRQPAAFCGLVGVKPTYGRISRYGLVAYASSLDQIGPLAANVTDAAAILDIICGDDPLDSTAAPRFAPDLTSGLDKPVENLVIGVPLQARSDANHPAVAAALDAAIEKYKAMGAEIIDIDLPLLDHAVAAYYIVAPAEASSNLARYDGIRYGRRAELSNKAALADVYTRSRAEGFGKEVQRRIMLGTHVLSSGYYDAYYNTALQVRAKLLAEFTAAFEPPAACHAILMPATPGPAFRIGEKTTDPLAMYLEDIYTVAVNLAGLPALTMPASTADIDGAKLPIGVQLIGRPFEESTLLRTARMLEMV